MILIALATTVVNARPDVPLLMRDPTVSETQIAFGYAGSIWTANLDGSNARRLTRGGHERKPIFSPDGSKIAFTGDHDGMYGFVYVVPATGGQPRRLTSHPRDFEAVGWTPDGERILFASGRAAFSLYPDEVCQLFTVSTAGGPATAVPLVRASEGSYSPDRTRIAYVPNVQWRNALDAWKHYRGGQTRPIWIASLVNSNVEARIPRDNSNDFNPMWIGDRIYFLSDRIGPVTLFSYDLQSKEVKLVVQASDLDIKSASSSVNSIVYERFGSLRLLDLKTGTDRALDIRLEGDFPEVVPSLRKIEPKDWRSPALSPTGTHAAFSARGEILTVSAEGGDASNVTKTTNAVERDAAWSPDGTSLAYFSNESGEYALHVRDWTGHGPVRKIDLGRPASFYRAPVWSPDSKKIAYTDKRLNYWYVDLERKQPVRVDRDDYVNPVQGLQLAWSPDSRWIAYTKQLPSLAHAIFVHSIDAGESYPLTDGTSDALHVAFDKQGRYLYLTASTDLALKAGWSDMSSLQRKVTRRVYAIVLRKDGMSPLNGGIVEPSLAHHARVTSGLDESATKVEIDLEGIRERIVGLPIPARDYQRLFVGDSGDLVLLEGSADVTLENFRTVPMNVSMFDGKTLRAERILDEVNPSIQLSFDGKKLLYAKHNRWYIASVQRQAEEELSRRGRERVLRLESMPILVDPRAEWSLMYDQVWRNQRDFLYDPGLHGLDLKTIDKRYRPYLAGLSSREDLNYLFKEMLGNISVDHLFVGGGDIPRPSHTDVGLLGADFSVDAGRYRIERVYAGDPWDPTMRAPLGQLGASVQAGEYLLAVDGRDVDASVDVYQFFEKTVDRDVVIKVGRRPDGRGAREISVVPIGSELRLRNFAWIEDNRRRVTELSGGRVAYVYLPDTGEDGYANFNRYYFSQGGKQAAIIDVRYNHGGYYSDYIIDYMRRPVLGYLHLREGRDLTTPMAGIFGPKVMLINEMSGSGGDSLPWMFRRAGIGPLVGKRTWGGLVGNPLNPGDLLDGGYVSTPSYSFYTPEGAWEVSNNGVSPDIEAEFDPGAARAGRDSQLERAVQVILELLEKKPPPPAPSHPPYPNRGRIDAWFPAIPRAIDGYE